MERHKTIGDNTPLAPRTRVGGETDAWCTRCRMVLNHTILAMEAGEVVRVQCRTCGSQHRYKNTVSGQRRERATPAARTGNTGTWAPPSPKRAERAWLEASSGRDLRNPIAYHPKTTFAIGQVILHVKFGTGVVMGERDGKIVVVFEDETRVLVHARA